MLEVKTKEGKALISESGIISILEDSYYPEKDIGYYMLTISYIRYGNITLKFSSKADASEALIYIKDNTSGVIDIATGREEYIRGFKEGVDYALKLTK